MFGVRRRVVALFFACAVVAAVLVAKPGAAAVPAASYRAAVMADSPVAYWRFATTASETGNHNGSLRGSPAPLLNQNGPFGGDRAIRFDGVSRGNQTGGFLANSLARLPSGTWNNGYTIEAWAKTTTNGPEQHVATWSDSDGAAGPGVLFDDDDNRWKFRDGNVSLSMNHGTTINAWHYIVATVGKLGNGKLYVDGQEVRGWNSGVKPEASSGGLFTVGADYDGGTIVDTPFNGWIAETAVYNKPLGPARIQAHFAARFATTTTTTGSSTSSSTSTTTTTVPTGCTGTPVNQPSDISQPNTTYCLSGVHNWTLHPKSGDTLVGGILDGGKSTGFAIVADPCVTNVTLRNIEVRNYTVNGGDFRGAITVQDNCATGWKLNNLHVHHIGVVGSGGAGAELSNGWVVTGGRYNDNAQEGLTNGDGEAFTVDGAELDHNNFTDATYTQQSVSCGHEAGGMKFVGDGVTVKNSNVHHNACLGLWADISSDRITLTNNNIHDNWNSGVQIEISLGATVTGNTITHNGFSSNGGFHSGCEGPVGSGIFNSSSGNVNGTNASLLFSGNTLSANCNGINLANFSDSCCRAANTTVSNNTIGGCDSTNCTAAEVGLAQNFTGYWGSNWPDGNSFSGNTFSHGAIFCERACG